jgi:hypothetical protein
MKIRDPHQLSGSEINEIYHRTTTRISPAINTGERACHKPYDENGRFYGDVERPKEERRMPGFRIML